MDILRAAIQAADPTGAVIRGMSLDGSRLMMGQDSINLDECRRIWVVGAGKAVVDMAAGLQAMIGERITGGVLIAKHLPGVEERVRLTPDLHIYQGQHPVPGAGSVQATQALVDLLARCGPDDLVFCLISGGGSALMTLPQPGVSLADIQEMTRLLLGSGAEIGEINILRKHVDQIKGGGLARFAYPARVVTFILSDVVGSPLSSIASGPTVADPSTYVDALEILEKYSLRGKAPRSILGVLEQGAAGEIAETVKRGDALLERVHNRLIASNYQSAQAAVEQARQAGFHALLLTTYLKGEARWAGEFLCSLLRQAGDSGDPLPRPFCMAAGGETTVMLGSTPGKGGRNQELALAAVENLAGLKDVLLVTLATDGEDGPTDAAGAAVDGRSFARARALGLDPRRALDQHDAYPFFAALDDLLLTGATGTNVNDLTFLFGF